MIKKVLLLALSGLFSLVATADVFFSQPPSASGGLIQSSWADPEGTDGDFYAYDGFIVTSNCPISEVRWRGGYIRDAMYTAHAWKFTITFYESAVGGTQPHINNPQGPEFFLAKYTINGNAGETPVAGTSLYDYAHVLPTPFQATAGVKYWIRIQASQIGLPDWGISVGTGGDSSHFNFSTGMARFYYGAGDEAFTLHAPPGPYFTVATHPSPDFGGTTSGDGVFTNGSSVTVQATADPGYSFVNWTTNGVVARTTASYTFTIRSNVNLVANFLPAYAITTSPSPPSGGTTSPTAASYPYGNPVTVTATAKSSYTFVNWTENGVPVSVAKNYTFNSSGNRALVANFVPARTNTVTVISRPHLENSGTIVKSAWYPPDGLNGDQFVWDSFSNVTAQAITEVRWRGGYTNYKSGAGKSPVYDFTVYIYPAGVGAPDLNAGYLVRYYVGNNANETAIGTFGGTDMYDYRFVLPAAFQAAAGTTYWLEIVASQGLTPTYYWPPDWGFAVGTGGDAHHFQKVSNGGMGVYNYDVAFSLIGPGSDFSVNALASPDTGGTVDGGGVFTNGASTTLTATPADGYVFVNWNENGTTISTVTNFNITVTTNRTLVANFAQAFNITTDAQPTGGGTATGGGTCLTGSNVVLTATANAGYLFINWTEYDWEVSTDAKYYFIADSDRALVANFAQVHTITTSVTPASSGFVAGGGTFVSGTSITLLPTPNTGYTFVNWIEGGAPVCNWPGYTFNVTANRTLVAQFAPACAITTSSSADGFTTGGVYPSGANATATAVAKTGYTFVNWTENGLPVSTSANYDFAATTNRALVANFTQDVTSVTFDFDTSAPALTTGEVTPLEQTATGVKASFGAAFSVQNDASLGWMIPKFAGNYLYPDSGGNWLEIQFSEPLRSVTLTFATLDSQEVVTPSSVQLTAYQDTTAVGTTNVTGNYTAGDTLPTGALTFNSGTPFNAIMLASTTDFLIDNITVAGIPRVNIARSTGNELLLAWPAPAFGWELLENGDLTTTNWLPSALTVNNGQVIVPATGKQRFFRLRHP